FDLYSASFFARSAEERFLNLMMSIETLIRSRPSSPETIGHVQQLIEMTQRGDIPSSERDSLIGRLGQLKNESIRTAGRNLMRERLPEREYQAMSAPDFFDHCYNLRSTLVHGAAPRPGRGVVGSAAATLEVLVSNLLSGPLLDVEV
ncbi:MAG: hypothetical protein ACREX3_13600, partial [Gammaproteobacteria bacterium]